MEMFPRHVWLTAALTALAACGLCASVHAAEQAPGLIHFDFEDGTLDGWKIVEGGFDKFVCDRAVFHNGGEPYNKHGKYFLSTLEQQDQRPSDRFTGAAESPVFLLKAPEMSLLVGGGSHKDTYVALCTVDGQEVLQARGKNTEFMQSIEWLAPELVGKRVFVRIVDGNTGGWGHTTFDDFKAQGVIDPDATAENFAQQRSVLEELRLAGLPAPGAPETLRAALKDLIETFGDRYPRGPEFLTRLQAIEERLAAASQVSRRAVLADFRSLQKEALVANPLVCEQPILFVARPQYRADHHNTATMFQAGEINAGSFQGGGALKTIDFGKGGEVRALMVVAGGIARDPDVHFSGRKIVFSMRESPGDDYHIYEIDAVGANLTRLTSASGITDIDPLYLPDDAIAFSSTREPKYCMCNRHIMANLYRMDPDGANIHQIGKSTLMEGHGTLTEDGRLLYNRWEYVDRNFGDAQGLWTVNPDGTNHAVYWGNNTTSPGAVLDARVIPGTELTLCTFSSCHDRPWGALAIVDRQRAIDGRGGMVRTWPADAIDRVDRDGFDSYVSLFPKYEDPYPLSDAVTGAGAGRYFLCSRMTGRGEQMGIFLLDVFGNEVLLHSEETGCFDPMPLGARPRPPVIPSRRDFAGEEGRFYVLDVYQGTHMQGVKPGAVKYLRVVESPEKRFWTPASWGGQGVECPAINWHDFNNKRILGTVPVAEDGSVYFSVPADKFVYFQLLDENKMMIQSMRSGTMVQSGETTGCVGCHDSRHGAPSMAKRKAPVAARGRPRKLDGWFGPPRLFSYVREVQPVFDRYCVSCHDYGKPAGEKLNLAGDRGVTFNTSYNELWRKRAINVVGAGPAETQQAYSWGSAASKLVATLRSGHPETGIDQESFERIVTWIDINGPYYETYASAYPSNLSGRCPLGNDQLDRLSQLTGVPFSAQATFSTNAGPQICFERPELSPCLAKWTDKESPEYREALSIIRDGKQMLAARPRADMEGFVPCEVDERRDRKYAERLRIESRNRKAIHEGRKAFDNEAG